MILMHFIPSGSAQWAVLDHADQPIATVAARAGALVITPTRRLSHDEQRSIAGFLAQR